MTGTPPRQTSEEDPLEPPPILGSWASMYAFVLLLHLVLIICFYLLSRAYT